MRKIVWIADYNELEHSGGAQQTNRFLIDYGRNLGFYIIEANCRDLKRFGLPKGDFYILNNISLIWRNAHDAVIEIIKNRKYIRYEHDYLWTASIDVELVFRNALATIFLSPAHRKEHEKRRIFPSVVHLQPSPVDLKKFKIKKRKRKKNSVLYAGGIAPHKGLDRVIEYARTSPHLKFTIIGWVEQEYDKRISLPFNCTIAEKAPHEKMPDILNQYEYFIHLPNWIEPFGRAPLEAYLCGCKLIVDTAKIGLFSYPWDFSNYDTIVKEMEEAPKRFWQFIYSVVYK